MNKRQKKIYNRLSYLLHVAACEGDWSTRTFFYEEIRRFPGVINL